MLHKEVGLTDATITDQGRFEAIAATWSVDRQNEQIIKGAFEDTITAWQHRARPVPIHWNHEGSAENVIGSINPESMVETDEGLRVEGQLDLETSEVAREAWRSMRAGRIALSFGYMVTADFKREDGVRELLGVDLFEISMVAAPANPDTRILSMKAADRGAEALAGIFSEFLTGNYGRGPGGVAVRDSADTEHDRKDRDRELQALIDEVEADEAKERKQAERAARKARPIKVKTFEV